MSKPGKYVFHRAIWFPVFFITGVLHAEQPADSTGTYGFTGPSYGEFMKMTFILAIMILLIWLTLRVLRKMMSVKGGGISNVRLAGGIPLGSRRSIQFVNIGKSLYVLGVTDHHIELLNAIDDEERISEILDTNKTDAEPFSAFLQKFKSQPRREENE